jgi:hypothetical protein
VAPRRILCSFQFGGVRDALAGTGAAAALGGEMGGRPSLCGNARRFPLTHRPSANPSPRERHIFNSGEASGLGWREEEPWAMPRVGLPARAVVMTQGSVGSCPLMSGCSLLLVHA